MKYLVQTKEALTKDAWTTVSEHDTYEEAREHSEVFFKESPGQWWSVFSVES